MAKVSLTGPKIDAFTCPPEKKQAFLWDLAAPGLGLRKTPKGEPAYVFQSVYQGKTIRLTIGSTAVWQLEDSKRASPDGQSVVIQGARSKAKALQRLIDDGKDPRDLKRDALTEKRRKLEALATDAAIAAAKAITVADAWPQYLKEGKPKRRDSWKPRYRADLEAFASPGGVKKKRGKGNTRPGPLFPLMAMPLVEANEDTLKAWYDLEAVRSKNQAARALMMFRGFLRWCATRPEYRSLVDRHAGSAPALVQSLPQLKRRVDALQKDQVRGWWAGVEQLENRTASIYLRALLLTGARREELAALPWDEVDFQWRKLTIADKVEDSRVIPLTPYLAQMLATLPRVSKYVFASTGKAGRISDVRSSHAKVLKHAGIEHLTFHGLRRTFIQRGRGVAPAGVPAQIAGHKPSATAEGYAVLSLDDLRPYAEHVEAHILELAGVQFDPKAEPGGLRVVTG